MEFLGLIVFILIMLSVMKFTLSKIGINFALANQKSMNILNPISHIFKILFTGFKSDGMMNNYNQDKLFSSSNKGLLIDGMSKRLSTKDSFNHLALISRTGGGKTSSYVIPNIFKLANGKNSMVITDISGELHNQTSGYLKQQGYKIYVLNPEDLTESIGYNPLYYATDSTKIDELVSILIKSNKESSKSSAENEYWDNGAKSILSTLIKLVISMKNHKYINLANIKHLINNFGTDGANLHHLVDEFGDDTVYNEFKGFMGMNPQTLMSIMANANIALSPIAINENLAKLTANHTINFDNFRKEKSVIYIKIPGQKQKQYRFLLNIFYHQFFNNMMETLPLKNDLPIYALLDEFGNMNLPDFDTTITTIRKYNVSISIMLQDINQLESKYGKVNAQTIINGGISNKLYYNGADLPTTEALSKIFGLKEEIKIDIDGNYYFKDQAVMRADEIRMIKDNEALFITANKLPAKFKIKPYYKDFVFNQYSKIIPFKINAGDYMNNIEYIDLES
ncbi:MAG: hypothetical protein DRG78_01970 [Epsilonproteobacteria bacterium]|nr:MAG: hypothetical protein DRG78_01970 [Campylobacterota bacterium]